MCSELSVSSSYTIKSVQEQCHKLCFDMHSPSLLVDVPFIQPTSCRQSGVRRLPIFLGYLLHAQHYFTNSMAESASTSLYSVISQNFMRFP